MIKLAERIEFKQYDTIEFACAMTDDDGTVYDLTGLTLYVDVESSAGKIVDTMRVDIVDAAAGMFILTPNKTDYAVGKYTAEVLIQCAPNVRKSSDNTFDFYIKRAITAPRNF